MQINKDIQRILANCTKSIVNLQKIHNINYTNLLPKSVNLFKRTEKFLKNGVSYDLYGWKDDVLVDIYPTYDNIILKEDLPKSWITFINSVIGATKINKFSLIIYNKKQKKFTNVVHFSNQEPITIKDNHEVTQDWVRATANKNYIMEDTIHDIVGKKRKRSDSIEEMGEDEEEIMERMNMGNIFEADIIHRIIENHYVNFVKIAESYQAKELEKYKATLKEMKRGTPIIHQAVLHNPTTKEYGCVDLLVRSDYINKLCKMEYPFNFTSGTKTNTPHYVIVDIKWHKLQLNVDKTTVRNEGMVETFKAQLCVYNNALGYMQGYLPNNAYILGRGWKQTRMEKGEQITEGSQDPFDKLGAIEFKERDSNIAVKAEEARKWLAEVNEKEFDVKNPKYNHSHPNMSNNYDYPNKKLKVDLAEEKNELTMIAHVSPKHRETAKDNGITCYLDPDISAEKLGIRGKTGELVDTLLENQKMTCAMKGTYDIPAKLDVEIFMDFEYMFCFNEEENIPYLCGIGWVKEDKWEFEYVLLESLKMESRKKMCEDIINLIKKVNSKRIFTWSDVDRRLLINLCKKFGLDELKELEWIDAYKFCMNNRINFRGARRYGLKEIGRVMKLNELTDLSWENNLVGSSAGVRKYYYNNEKWDTTKVIKYNEVDCKMVSEVIRNLREYNINSSNLSH